MLQAAFIAKNIARGVRHLERPEVILDVPNKSPYRRWPAMIQNVDIKITGAPEVLSLLALLVQRNKD